jgi:membrane protease YdiL (CAAX protease family)
MVLAQQAVLAGVSLLVATKAWIPLFPKPRWSTGAVALALALFATQGAIAFVRSKRRVARHDPRLWMLTPRGGRERSLWVAVALSAGIGEEISYRGVLFVLLWRATGSALAAAAIAAVAFALAHVAQGWAVVGIVAVYALGFHALVWISGSLYLAMIVHFAHDLWVGLWVARLVAKEGWEPGMEVATVPRP